VGGEGGGKLGRTVVQYISALHFIAQYSI
jgi:hypothetical protein